MGYISKKVQYFFSVISKKETYVIKSYITLSKICYSMVYFDIWILLAYG